MGQLGENISYGSITAADVISGWMSSDGHCANIMNPDFEHFGAGYAEVSGSFYYPTWTQTFGAKL